MPTWTHLGTTHSLPFKALARLPKAFLSQRENRDRDRDLDLRLWQAFRKPLPIQEIPDAEETLQS